MRLIAGMVSTTPTTGKKQFEVLYRFFSMLRSEWATYGGRRWHTAQPHSNQAAKEKQLGRGQQWAM